MLIAKVALWMTLHVSLLVALIHMRCHLALAAETNLLRNENGAIAKTDGTVVQTVLTRDVAGKSVAIREKASDRTAQRTHTVQQALQHGARRRLVRAAAAQTCRRNNLALAKGLKRARRMRSVHHSGKLRLAHQTRQILEKQTLLQVAASTNVAMIALPNSENLHETQTTEDE